MVPCEDGVAAKNLEGTVASRDCGGGEGYNGSTEASEIVVDDEEAV